MKNGFNRREVLGMGLAAGLPACLAMGQQPLPQTEKPRRKSGHPKNIIFMVADGMSMGVPSLGEPFSQIARNKGTTWYELSQNPEIVHGWLEMTSLNSLVTDSSAASSSWGSGSRVFNGAVNVLPDGTRLTPISQLVKDAGMNIGLVTTTSVAHATPAGFASIDASRDNMDGIARQYLDHVDIVLGGGLKNFASKYRHDKTDLIDEYKKAGYQYFDNRKDLLNAGKTHLRALGLFSKDHIPYVLDQKTNPELDDKTPSLADMTRVALEKLSQSDKGFLLQVEGGRIDHAGHGNDAASIMWEFLDYDDAVKVVFDFAQKHPDTLVIMTTDHGNSNPGLVGIGSRYKNSNQALEQLATFKYTLGTIRHHLRKAGDDKKPTPKQSREVIKELLGFELDEKEAEIVSALMKDGHVPDANNQLRGYVGCMGQILGNTCGIQWTGVTHTADYTLLYAWGPGSDRFQSLLRNTDVFTQLTNLIGREFKNPEMSALDAQKYVASWNPPDSVYRHLGSGDAYA